MSTPESKLEEAAAKVTAEIAKAKSIWRQNRTFAETNHRAEGDNRGRQK